MVTILALAFGILLGPLLGTVGGGSILTVPVLVYALDQDVHDATAASLVIVGTTALIAAIPHARAGWVAPQVAFVFGGVGIVGAFASAWLNARIAPVILLLSGVLMLLVALRMAVGHRTRVPTATPEAPGAVRWPVPASGFGVGRLTGFFGVGGGFLIVPALMLILGLPMRLAAGTSLVVIAINAAGTVAHAGRGGVDAAVAVPFVTGGVVGAMLGGRIAAHVNDSALARGFAALLRSLAST